jgi:transposase-like protein
MRKSNVSELEGQEQIVDPLTELLRKGAEQLIFRSVDAELQEMLREHSDWRTEDGNSGVVRNGYQPEREVQTGVGPVTVRIPKVRSKTGDAVTFRSALVPPYVRKTKSLEAALPWLYLKGISTGEMREALQVLVGPNAKGLSDERGIAGIGRAECKRVVAVSGVEAETGVGQRIYDVA